MKLKSILLTLLLGCGSVEGLPPHIEGRIKPINTTIMYDSYLKIRCKSSKGEYVLDPPKCIPGHGKVMYTNNKCTDFDSIIPIDFLEIPAKYATSTDIGQFYSIDSTAKLKGPGLYEVVNWQCVQVLSPITAYDIETVASYQIFGDL